MILALLRGEWSGDVAIGTVLRAAWYALTLGGAGLGLFAVLLRARQAPADAARARRWIGLATGLAAVVAACSLTAQVATLAGGDTVLDRELWAMVLGSGPGVSVLLGCLGLLLLAMTVARPRLAPAALLGIAAVCASYAMVGHTTRMEPRWLFAAVLMVHLGIAAYWIGSLPPLAWAARRDGAAAAGLVEDWARGAAVAVPVLALMGLVLAWCILGGVAPLFGTQYGWALIAKVLFVSVMLGFAALHRFRLTPRLAAGGPGAGRAFAASVAVEGVVALLVLYAAAELTSTSPMGMG